MVNAWSLAASILNGTFDEDYPMKEEHSDAWYDYKRNDPNAENPFTDPEDWARAESVVGNGNTAGISTDLYSNDELDLNVDFNVDFSIKYIWKRYFVTIYYVNKKFWILYLHLTNI